MLNILTITQSKNDLIKYTEEELEEWGEDVLYPKIVVHTDPKEIEEAKLLSQEVTLKEFEEL